MEISQHNKTNMEKKARITKKLIREIIIGKYAESIGMTFETLDMDKVHQSIKFADDLMEFINRHELLKSEILEK